MARDFVIRRYMTERITVHLDSSLKYHDTGGGCRETFASIFVDDSLTKRQQRKVVIYETLGSLLEYAITHEQLEDIADKLMSALDQIDPCEEV